MKRRLWENRYTSLVKAPKIQFHSLPTSVLDLKCCYSFVLRIYKHYSVL